MLVLLIAGCGSIGGSNDPTPAPTATVWPTVNDAAEATSPEASPPWQMIEPTATDTAASPTVVQTSPIATESHGTPVATLPVEASSSPMSTEVIATMPPEAVGTPEVTLEGAGTPVGATPQPPTAEVATIASTVPTSDQPVVQQANAETGDGTSGPPAVADLPARTPTSAGPATPAGSPVASPQVGARVLVTSCSPQEVPAFTGSDASYITTSDVNIRIGPGTDCDPAADILPQGTLLTVTSGEVVRDGDTGTTWVRVDVDGLEGWVSVEYIQPAGE
ncbi:MAG: SH3 domain-containing protein [Thermomicrobiales bacterium]